jgi:carbonic anhydrase
MCDGRYQSPIDLPDICTHANDAVVVDGSLKLLLNNYDRPIDGEKVSIENNGHTAVVHINGTDTVSDDAPWITGPALGGHHFQLQQIHFHWNRNGSHEGSEHAIGGRKTSFEMHLVHFNTKYDAFQNAGDHPDGSAVLSVLFDFEDCDPSETCSDDTNDNAALNPILARIAKVNDADDAVVLDHLTLDLRALLPDNIDTFYWYQGSLTTPPCSEDLTWIVFPEIQPISRNQLHTFEYNFKNDEGKLLGTTNRDIQPLNGRILLISNDNHCRKKNTNGLIGKTANGVLSLVSDIVSK